MNDGNLTASLGGYIALLAPEVRNNGVIVAQMGTVALAAGESYTLQFDGNNTLANIAVTPATIKALVENNKAVQAPGGLIILSAQALDHLQGGVVHNSGALVATGLVNNGGVIRLSASDTINQTGIINADAAPNSSGNGGTISIISNLANPNSLTTIDGSISAQGGTASVPPASGGDLGRGNGGTIETSGHSLKIGNDATITTAATMGLTGSWLLDPVDFNIAATGGDITGSALGTLLGSNSVTIQTATGTNSSTNVYANVSTGTSGNINVNDPVSWSANTSLTLNAYGSININKTITASGTTGALALYYGQGAVNASNTATYNVNTPVNLMAGNNFSTKLGSDGSVVNYKVITSLGVAGDATSAPATMTLQGMAATASLGGNYVLGANIVDSSPSMSTWNGNAGFTPIGTAAANFTGVFDGLGHTVSGLTINRPSTNNVGLFGYAAQTSSIIRNVGIVGGSVTGSGNVGGLAGTGEGSISNSYATGSVSGNGSNIGGLVGMFAYNFASTINDSYATGHVSGGSNVGGLVGTNTQGTITNSFWDKTTSGQTTSAGGTGMTTAQMQTQANFTSATSANGNANPGWDFTKPVWKIVSSVNQGYPCLAWSAACVAPPTQIYLDLLAGSSIYGSTPSFTYGYYTTATYGSGTQITDASPTGTIVWSGAPTSTSNVNTYSVSYGSGITLGNSGYTLAAGTAVNWSITALPVTLTGTTTYNGSTSIAGSLLSVSNTVNGNTVTVSGTGTLASANAGSRSLSNLTSLTLSSSNYTVTGGSGTVTVGKAPLIVTANDANKISNGVSYSGGNGVIYTGFVNNETQTVLSGSLNYSGSSQGATNAGSYAIAPQGLSNGNYQIAFVNGTLTINPAAPPVVGPPPPALPPVAPPLPPASEPTPAPAAPAAGAAGSSGTTRTAAVDDNGISVSLVRQASIQQTGFITVSVPKEMATAGSGFSFPLPAQVTDAETGNNAVNSVTTVSGQPLPSLIRKPKLLSRPQYRMEPFRCRWRLPSAANVRPL